MENIVFAEGCKERYYPSLLKHGANVTYPVERIHLNVVKFAAYSYDEVIAAIAEQGNTIWLSDGYGYLRFTVLYSDDTCAIIRNGVSVLELVK